MYRTKSNETSLRLSLNPWIKSWSCCLLWLKSINSCHLTWSTRCSRRDLMSKKRSLLFNSPSIPPASAASLFSLDGLYSTMPFHFICFSFMRRSQYEASSFRGNHCNVYFSEEFQHFLQQVDYIMERKVKKGDWMPLTQFPVHYLLGKYLKL